jgi:CDP-diacylglycerol---glycerol-3-phosphate 3-phosphatidyltransferase
MGFIDIVRDVIRYVIRQFARWLNKVTYGRLRPNDVTIFGFLMHIPIAYLIATGYYLVAAILIVIFGLFDTLDGELARLQGSDNVMGGLLDALTDRLKEVVLYTGAAYSLIQTSYTAAAWCVVACGASLCVSYVKAKGEAALANKSKGIHHHKLNYVFQDGIMSFEVRMAVLIIGLLVNRLEWAIIFIAITSLWTIIPRFRHIAKELQP